MSETDVDKPHPGGERMPDEPDTPQSADEARHWAEMYRRIVAFEEQMLGRMREMQADLPADVQAEVQQSNIAPMEKLINTYRDRVKGLERSLIRLEPENREG